jgi:putative flippase GtrA
LEVSFYSQFRIPNHIVLAEAEGDHLKEYLKQSGQFLSVCFLGLYINFYYSSHNFSSRQIERWIFIDMCKMMA